MRVSKELEAQILATPGVKVGPQPKAILPRPGKNASERTFMEWVILQARLAGWMIAHFRGVRIQRADGTSYWQTPVQADGAGWPDLVLVRDSRFITAELKTEKGVPSHAQFAWLAALDCVPSIETYIWRPRDWEAIERILA